VHCLVAAAVGLFVPALLAQPTVIDFEDFEAGQLPGDTVPGMTTTTCDIPYDIAAGDVITPTHNTDGFWLVTDDDRWAGDGAVVDPPQVSAASGLSTEYSARCEDGEVVERR